MGSMLKQIQDDMAKYTETIASVLNVDIEIVDDRLVRISGSGVYKYNIDEIPITEGYLYNQVIKSSKEIVVLDIANNDVCRQCEKQVKCIDKTIIAVPIKYNKRTVGVIGAISINKDKKEEITKKIKSYLEFINHIADLISVKIEEYENNKTADKKIHMLREIMDNIEKGVLILDSGSQISYINNISMKRLNLDEGAVGKVVKIRAIENSENKNEILKFSVDDTIYSTKFKIIPVHPYINNYDKIIIFDEIQKNSIEEINSKWEVKKIDSIIGESEIMSQVKMKTKRISKSNSTVLITGDSGTGKELIAKAIHAEGCRKNKPFIAINCAAIPESLLESELFGYVKGAFSGASSGGKIGKFELANEGVIFLDEIGDLSMHLQAKLLRVLQERKFARIGSNKLIDLDLRVIAATNKNILELVNKGKFRDDLYYRLNVIPINLPSLKERKEDIKEIMMKFISKYSVEFNVKLDKIEDCVMDMLIDYNWPGNIRELENSVEYMMNLIGEEGIISKDMIPLDIINYHKYKNKNIDTETEKEKEKDSDRKGESKSNLFDYINEDIIESKDGILPMKDLELLYINNILDKYGRDTKSKKQIAKKLGIGLSTLYRKLDEA